MSSNMLFKSKKRKLMRYRYLLITIITIIIVLLVIFISTIKRNTKEKKSTELESVK